MPISISTFNINGGESSSGGASDIPNPPADQASHDFQQRLNPDNDSNQQKERDSKDKPKQSQRRPEDKHSTDANKTSSTENAGTLEEAILTALLQQTMGKDKLARQAKPGSEKEPASLNLNSLLELAEEGLSKGQAKGEGTKDKLLKQDSNPSGGALTAAFGQLQQDFKIPGVSEVKASAQLVERPNQMQELANLIRDNVSQMHASDNGVHIVFNDNLAPGQTPVEVTILKEPDTNRLSVAFNIPPGAESYLHSSQTGSFSAEAASSLKTHLTQLGFNAEISTNRMVVAPVDHQNMNAASTSFNPLTQAPAAQAPAGAQAGSGSNAQTGGDQGGQQQGQNFQQGQQGQQQGRNVFDYDENETRKA